MYVIVVKCSVSGKRRNKVVHGYVSTSKHTKHNAIVSAERADDALYLTTVVSPVLARRVHVTCQRFVGGASAQGVEIFAGFTVLVDPDADPMIAGEV